MAARSFVPGPDESAAGALEVKVGERFFELRRQDPCPLPGEWLQVGVLGDGRRGWVLKDSIAACARAFEETAKMLPTFRPFWDSPDACRRLLSRITGVWQDDRKFPKIYTVTPLGDAANVLSEMPSGQCKRGKGLLQIRKVGCKHVIMWAETFCIDAEAGAGRLKWLPIDETKHSTWSWVRR